MPIPQGGDPFRLSAREWRRVRDAALGRSPGVDTPPQRLGAAIRGRNNTGHMIHPGFCYQAKYYGLAHPRSKTFSDLAPPLPRARAVAEIEDVDATFCQQLQPPVTPRRALRPDETGLFDAIGPMLIYGKEQWLGSTKRAYARLIYDTAHEHADYTSARVVSDYYGPLRVLASQAAGTTAGGDWALVVRTQPPDLYVRLEEDLHLHSTQHADGVAAKIQDGDYNLVGDVTVYTPRNASWPAGDPLSGQARDTFAAGTRGWARWWPIAGVYVFEPPAHGNYVVVGQLEADLAPGGTADMALLDGLSADRPSTITVAASPLVRHHTLHQGAWVAAAWYTRGSESEWIVISAQDEAAS